MRLKKLVVAQELLLQCLGPYPEGRTVKAIADEIPSDAEIVSVALLHGGSNVEMVLRSLTFAKLQPEEAIPFLTPCYQVELR